MFKPQKMSRVLIVGSKDDLEEIIEALHSLNIAHIKDFTHEIGGLKPGYPLQQASTTSKKLLKLRSVSSVLEITDQEIEEKLNIKTLSEEFDQKLDELENRVSHVIKIKNEITTELERTKQILDDSQPLKVLPPELRLDYEALAVFVGYEKKEIEAFLKKITRDYEMHSAKYDKRRLVAIFVPKDIEKKVYELLELTGFESLALPEIKDNLGSFFNKLEEKCKKLEEEMEQINEELESIKEEHSAFILASEEHLSIQIEKAEAPLRFATSDNFFIIDCWIPTKRFNEVERKLSTEVHGNIAIQRLEEEEDEEGPTALENPKPVRSFEFLLNMFSTPKRREVDPTFILFVVFSIFFGFIIGDLGYGILIILLGIYLRKRYILGIGGGGVADPLIMGGICASIFGLVVFAEAFAFPLPFHPMIHKLEIRGVNELLVISIVAAFFHLSLGFILGFINKVRHSIKEAIGKIGWLFILFAIFLLLMLIAERTQVGGWVCTHLLFSIQKNNINLGGLQVPIFSLYFLVIGFIMLLVFEGGLAAMEILSLVGNVASYMRLAAVGVAKGATALAFNSMLLPMMSDGGISFIIGGLLLIGMHTLVFLLGTMSAGIQAIRLNYVEFFLKFYEGGGIKFKPFGHVRRYTTI